MKFPFTKEQALSQALPPTQRSRKQRTHPLNLEEKMEKRSDKTPPFELPTPPKKNHPKMTIQLLS
jgi:hypothetical protein